MLNTFEKLSESKQIAILDAAASVFAEKGFFQAGIAEICKKAGISNGALYKYFKNKDDLYKAVINRAIDLMVGQMNEVNNLEAPFFDGLALGLKETASFCRRHRDYMVVYLDLGSPSMDRFAMVLSESIEGVAQEFWEDQVERGKARSEIDEYIDSSLAAYFMDNHLMLFMFSLISEHYNQRFHRFFKADGRELDVDEKIGIILRSARRFLS